MQPRTDLRRQTNALRLATTQRICRPPKLEITQSNITHKAQSRHNFLEDQPRDRHLLLVKLQLVRKYIKRIIHAEITHIHDAQPLDRHCQHDRFQTRTLTRKAGSFAHKSLDILAHKFALGVLPASFEIWDDTFVGRIVVPPTAEFDTIFLLARAIQYFMPCLFG